MGPDQRMQVSCYGACARAAAHNLPNRKWQELRGHQQPSPLDDVIKRPLEPRQQKHVDKNIPGQGGVAYLIL